MNAEQLIAFLQTVPPDAHIVINGDVVQQAKHVPGRSSDGYYNRQFRRPTRAVKARWCSCTFLKARMVPLI